MLSGAEIFYDILTDEQFRSSTTSLIFRNSVFGYIATGSLKTTPENFNVYCGLAANYDNLDKLVGKF